MTSATPPAGRVHQIPRLGHLLIGHGILFLVWTAFCLFAISVGVLNAKLGTATKTEDLLVIVAYGIFGLAALPVGVLQIVAGSSLLRNKGRVLALVALFAGLASFFLGTVFCLPTGVALLVFGMLVLMDPAVKEKLG